MLITLGNCKFTTLDNLPTTAICTARKIFRMPAMSMFHTLQEILRQEQMHIFQTFNTALYLTHREGARVDTKLYVRNDLF